MNISAPKFIKQTLLSLKEQIGSDTIILGDLNTPFSSIGRTSRQKINKETLELNNPMDEMGLADIYRVFHPTAVDTHFAQQPMELSPNG
jgi:hypothetical protein